MNKREASEALKVSVRLVEKYASEGRLGEVEYVRGKTGREASYKPEAVERLRLELETPDTQLQIAPNRRAASLDGAASEQALRVVTLLESIDAHLTAARESQAQAVAQAVAPLAESLEAIRAALAAPRVEPLMLSLAEAARVSGLSRDVLRAAIAAKRLRGRIIGRGFKVKRADLDAYVSKL